MIEKLVDQIEGRFAELERQMADPSVIADQARYAEVGREYRRLQYARGLARPSGGPSATTWRGRRSSWPRTGTIPSCARCVAEAPKRIEELEEAIRLAMVEADPNDDKNVIVELQGRNRRRRGGAVRAATSTRC